MKNRRNFLKKSALAVTGLTFVNSISAKSYRKIIGSNERIKIAFQGLGRRIPGLLSGAISQKILKLLTCVMLWIIKLQKHQKDFLI